MKNNIEIRSTGDGSPTLYSEKYDQTYHNPGGAVAESRHVFFEYSGLRQALENGESVTILETGFGTGLNLLLLIDYWRQYGFEQPLNFYSIEADPISARTARQMEYQSHLADSDLSSPIPNILNNCQTGDNTFTPCEGINVSLFIGDFSDFPTNRCQADYLFHDAFSPDVNPELWTGETFQKLRSNSRKDGVLTTYCAASRARGALSWAGWTVAEAEGALGKREMTVASPSKPRIDGLGYKLINNERMAHRYEIGDFD